jgi:hypothetical protein
MMTNRRLCHLLLLGALCCLPFLQGFGAAAPQSAAQMLARQVQPASAAETRMSDTAASDPIVAALAPAVVNPSPTPFVVQPAPSSWLQSFRQTSLWASERPDATTVGRLPQWAPLRVLSSQTGGRIPVDYPGDGSAQLPQHGWVNAEDVGPSGPPTPDFVLASGGYPSPNNGVMVPRRITQAWPVGISATYGAIIDGDSGELLWGRNAHGRIAPASLTKIMTALVALDHVSLSDRVNVTVDSHRMYESTIMGIEPGENLSMETLLYGMMLPSGNDAALQIATQVAGSEARFADMMNAKTAELGLVDSHWVNSHGLDADGHYTSPYDLCELARFGMRNPVFQKLAGTRRYEAEGYILLNLNRLLQAYPKADGVKVGYTDNAGRAIVGSATQDGHRVFVAILRSWDPVGEAQALLEYAFKGFSWS